MMENWAIWGLRCIYYSNVWHADYEGIFCSATATISNYKITFGHHLHKLINEVNFTSLQGARQFDSNYEQV